MFDMTLDSDLFFTNIAKDRVPLYEAKMFWHYGSSMGRCDRKHRGPHFELNENKSQFIRYSAFLRQKVRS